MALTLVGVSLRAEPGCPDYLHRSGPHGGETLHFCLGSWCSALPDWGALALLAVVLLQARHNVELALLTLRVDVRIAPDSH